MTESEMYRRLASSCCDNAAKASNPLAQDAILKLSETWLRKAALAEQREAAGKNSLASA